MLGADPEFIIASRRPNGGLDLIRANNFLIDLQSQIGCDGQSGRGPAELRPRAAQTPDGLVRNIKRLIGRVCASIPTNYQILAGSFQCNSPIGGHIHFQTCMPSPHMRATNPAITLLDYYLGIPLALIEDDGARRQRTEQYGAWGDCREQKWGFEYRTPPSWLVSEGMTTATIWLAHLLWINKDSLQVEEQRGLPQAFNNWNSAGGNVKSSRQVCTDYFFSRIEPVWNKIAAGTPAWGYLQGWKSLIRVGKSWDQSRDIRARWRVASTSEISPNLKCFPAHVNIERIMKGLRSKFSEYNGPMTTIMGGSHKGNQAIVGVPENRWEDFSRRVGRSNAALRQQLSLQPTGGQAFEIRIPLNMRMEPKRAIKAAEAALNLLEGERRTG